MHVNVKSEQRMDGWYIPTVQCRCRLKVKKSVECAHAQREEDQLWLCTFGTLSCQMFDCSQTRALQFVFNHEWKIA